MGVRGELSWWGASPRWGVVLVGSSPSRRVVLVGSCPRWRVVLVGSGES